MFNTQAYFSKKLFLLKIIKKNTYIKYTFAISVTNYVELLGKARCEQRGANYQMQDRTDKN